MAVQVLDIREFGATGNGVTKDTEGIQQTIDACHDEGGGRVVVPAGVYLTGTLYLKSNVELHLTAGAVLRASPDRSDYNSDDVFPENPVFFRENVTGAHLIIAYRQENVSITGLGRIDGNSGAFFGDLPAGETASYRFKSGCYEIRDWRPAQLIFFCLSKQITVTGVDIVDAPYWSLFLFGCTDAQVRGLRITNPPATRNGDGIDIDCSRNVVVSDCIIRSGDDCITVRCHGDALGEYVQPCEDIVVTNCILSTPCCAVRIGVGDGEIRRVRMSNLVIKEARTAINIVARYSPYQPHGAAIEDVHISNVTAEVTMPFVVTAGTDAERPAMIRGISFSQFDITASAGSQLSGSKNVPIERISLTDIRLRLTGGSDNTEFRTGELPTQLAVAGYQGKNGQPALPAALYGRHLRDAEFRDIRLTWSEPGKAWRDGIMLDDSEDVRFRAVEARQAHDDGAAIHCRQSADISIIGCRALPDTTTFARLRAVENSVVIHSDFSLASSAVDSDGHFVESGNIASR